MKYAAIKHSERLVDSGNGTLLMSFGFCSSEFGDNITGYAPLYTWQKGAISMTAEK